MNPTRQPRVVGEVRFSVVYGVMQPGTPKLGVNSGVFGGFQQSQRYLALGIAESEAQRFTVVIDRRYDNVVAIGQAREFVVVHPRVTVALGT